MKKKRKRTRTTMEVVDRLIVDAYRQPKPRKPSAQALAIDSLKKELEAVKAEAKSKGHAIRHLERQLDMKYPLAAILHLTNERLYENIIDFARAWAREQEEKPVLGEYAMAAAPAEKKP